MKREVKILILIFILLIPAALYIFLQTFGQNEYSLPVYPVGGVEKLSDTGVNERIYSDKIILPDMYDPQGHHLEQEVFSENIIVLELVSDGDNVLRRDYQINRVSDIFRKERSVRLLRVFEKGDTATYLEHDSGIDQRDNVSVCYIGIEEMRTLARHQLALGVDHDQKMALEQLVLIDKDQRIRGYYDIRDVEDIDRLILEIKILLNQKTNV